MSSKKGTSSSAGNTSGAKAGAGSPAMDQKKADEGKKYVKEKLGLGQGNKANKLKGKDQDFYGKEASKATNEYLVSIGEAKRTGGGGYNLTAKGWKMKYGSYTPGQAQEGAAMGTGNPVGIMTSTPISQPMWKQQQKTKAIILGGLSLATTGFSAMGLRAAAFDAINKSGQAGYSKYLGKFYTSQGKDASSFDVKNNNVDTSGTEVSSAGIINTSVTDNQEVDLAGSFKKKKAGQGADQIAGDRSLFATTNRTISGSMTT